MTRKQFWISLAVIAVIYAVLFWLGCRYGKAKTWDAEYPMANAAISWEQTFYSGAWGE